MEARRVLAICAAMLACAARAEPMGFLEEQKRFPRVREAIELKEEKIRRMFRESGVAYPPKAIYLRAFKASGAIELAAGEAKLELWANDASTGPFRLVREYRVCYHSGGRGPKRRAGDGQVPEGFYHIDRFNPRSQFHLSLGLDYPNASDRLLGAKGRLGGDIFIHGSCVSIGCLAMTDDKIRELYIAAAAARDNGQRRIPVHVFPMPMTPARMKDLESEGRRTGLWEFWRNLKEGYDLFERTRVPPEFRVDESGRYLFPGR